MIRTRQCPRPRRVERLWLGRCQPTTVDEDMILGRLLVLNGERLAGQR